MAKILGVNSTPSDDSLAASKYYVDNTLVSTGSIDPGTVIILSHGDIPNGWLLCDGTQYSETEYSDLYAIIGTAYDSHPTLGNPSTGNFRVPDLKDKFPLCYNPSGPSGAATLGIYGGNWNHTHNVPNHSHAITHTHALNNHTHTISNHTHSANDHTHSIPSHTHSYSSHTHWVPDHYHSHSLTVSIEHSHTIAAQNTGNAGTSANIPRSGVAAPNNTLNTNYSSYTIAISGVVGAGVSGDSGYASDAASGTTDPFSGNTGAPGWVVTDNASGLTTAGSTASTGAASTGSTDSSGAADTGSNNPPYFGINFIIKT